MMQIAQKIKKPFIGVLLLVSLITLSNTIMQYAVVWYTVDVFYFIIPLVFSLFFAKSVRNGTSLALLLWVPLFLVLYMVFAGLFFISTPLWNLINMLQVFVYGYVAGTGIRGG